MEFVRIWDGACGIRCCEGAPCPSQSSSWLSWPPSSPNFSPLFWQMSTTRQITVVSSLEIFFIYLCVFLLLFAFSFFVLPKTVSSKPKWSRNYSSIPENMIPEGEIWLVVMESSMFVRKDPLKLELSYCTVWSWISVYCFLAMNDSAVMIKNFLYCERCLATQILYNSSCMYKGIKDLCK